MRPTRGGLPPFSRLPGTLVRLPVEIRSKTALILCPLPGVAYKEGTVVHVSIWLYHRRHAPQIQAKLTMSSWRSPRSEPRRFAVIDQGPPRLIGNQHSQRATTARFQWPRATGSPSNRPLSIQGCRRTEAATSVASRLIRVRSFSQDRLDREKLTGREGFIGEELVPL